VSRATSDSHGALPLAGTLIVDAGGATTAYCAKLLWDLGADITVLEPPAGHDLRRRPPFDGQRPSQSLVFDWYHGASASVTVDPADTDQLQQATKEADVVLVAPGHSPWPTTEARPTWIPETALVCSITPFGRGGPYEGWKATHLVSASLAGAVHRHGPAEGPPLPPPSQIHWDHAGAHALLAVLAALRARPWSGPQEIDISAQETESIIDYYFERYIVTGAAPAPRAIGVGIPPTGMWLCADGWFEISAHQEHHWRAFLELLANPEELSEPALEDMAIRRELADSLNAIIGPLLASESRLELFERAQKVGLPSSVLNTPREFVADVQLADREAIVERDIDGRSVRLPASPLRADVRLSRDTPGVAAPRCGGPRSTRGPLPLSDVRVLSFGAFYAGNTTAALLAGLGADVAKIEAAARTEVLRRPAYSWERTTYTEPSGTPINAMYAVLARGAKNLSVDVKHPLGRELFRRMIPVVDVVVENFGMGTLDRWGLGFDALSALNERLVLLSMSGYGRTGPRSSYLAYAGNISNFSGLTSMQAPQGQLSDAMTAVHGAAAVVAAVDHAHRIERPIHLDIAQIEVMASSMAPAMLDPLVNGADTPADICAPGAAFWGIFRCLGIDSWLAIEATDTAQRAALANVVDRPRLATEELDPEQTVELRAAVAEWCSGYTNHSATQVLQRAGVPAGSVQSVEDVVRDPQLRHRRFPALLPHPDLGALEYPGALHHLSRTPTTPTPPAARLGGSTRDFLQRWLSLDAPEIDELERVGAIACFPSA
jgi:crotonobetainyl-CoA:carnitine CoA-transferase CaiB-like acyl-CoA transferase